jgi:UDPglucose 6-dehydrogenase
MGSNIKISFIGMTHLGLVSAVCAANKNFDVICYDESKELIKALNEKKLPIDEPQLDALLLKNEKNLHFTSSLNDINESDIVYVAPDIPTNDNGSSDLSVIKSYLNELAKIDSQDRITVILSQVPPGFTRNYEKVFSNLYYQVETLVFGNAVERSSFPERFILGQKSDEEINKNLKFFLDSYQCPILPMKYESAELAKIAINMFLVSSVTTANTIAELCERIGADFHQIIPALRLDKRIGNYSYLMPGLGISGGNLERDLTTFINFSNINKTDSQVVQAWKNNSAYRKNWPYQIFTEKIFPILKNPKVLILGLAYKENTHSVKNSPTLELINKIDKSKVFIYDPIINEYNDDHINLLNNINDKNLDYDVVLLMNQSNEFKEIEHSKLQNVKFFIDPFNLLDKAKLSKNSTIFSLGKKENVI